MRKALSLSNNGNSSNKVVAIQEHKQDGSNYVGQVWDYLHTKNGLMILGFAAVIAGLQITSNMNKKFKIATSYWGGSAEKKRAAKKAKKQIEGMTRNNVALYIGMPKEVRSRLNLEWFNQGLLKQKPSMSFGSSTQTMYLPDAQRGISVSGGAGAGKTFTVIDPLIRSSLDQGLPVCLYDFKFPSQAKRAAAYAMKRGYKVRVFAPGFPGSETCNIFDLIRDSEDAVGAGQLASIINRNANIGGGGDSGDKFFTDAAAALIQGVFLLTKAVEGMTGTKEYCDLMMASEIMNLPQFPQRMAAAREKMNVWTTEPLKQIISLADSEKTVASVIGTAQRVFQLFLKRDFIGSFCGETTLPLDLDGKEMIIFGLDRNNRDIVGPLLAAILHMIVTRNISRPAPRKQPLVVALDELPTLYLPQIANWFAEGREDGFCGIIGYQTFPQLEKMYGAEMAKTIFANTATKFIFNPQDSISAETYSKYLGEQEITFKSKSRSSGKGGGSTSTSDQHQKRALFEPAEFLKLPTGRAIIINPAYARKKEAYIPLNQSIKIPKVDIEEMQWSESKWSAIYEKLIDKNRNLVVDDQVRSKQLKERQELANKLFPAGEKTADKTQNKLEEIF